MQISSEYVSKIIDKRIIELEKSLGACEDYLSLVNSKNVALGNLKNKMMNVDWVEFDNFICAENAHTDHIINFVCRKGLKDGKNLPATFVDGQLF